ncbi:hypothetical protein L0668_13905 [Paraglaciecola aquimarina]|uniref:Soluble pyridine nucleotide transhydrogenase n=1 Tax=Paraglaciecola algarum TaxID=3050085 RepID=A0ABS9D8U0_9ALTE|nr:hypothetical protein [Paraglaciecola sp. G1-23]MCF2949210.1 hypothetical protein [Paraglaciecola sp. G1-23]
MRIKILSVVILYFFSSAIFAKDAPKSMFNCVNLKAYTIDQSCTSSLISTSEKYLTQQKELAFKMEQQNPNAMATVQFDPQQMLIKVIAHKKVEKPAKLLAVVHNSNSNTF